MSTTSAITTPRTHSQPGGAQINLRPLQPGGSPSSSVVTQSPAGNQGQSSTLTTPAGPHATATGATALSVVPNTTQVQKSWADLCNGANGLGVTALILGLVFGIGAWVGMNMQYHQGARGLELAIWTTCADHAVSTKGAALLRS
jgi:hypothetical protein